MKPFTLILALLACSANAQSASPDQTTDKCFVVYNLYLGRLQSGAGEYEENLKNAKTELKKCGKTFADVGIGARELAEFKKNSCFAAARHEYLRNSGTDPVGEKIYLRNLKAALAECRYLLAEITKISCQLAKETRYRTNGYCDALARSAK